MNWFKRTLLRGSVIHAKTELVLRHLVPEGDGYVEVGKRVIKGKVVTAAFVEYIVDNLITEVTAFGDFKYHDFGTGTNAEAAGDTALQTATGEARTTGTQVEGSANEYVSVATDTFAGTFAITEHGLFNASSTGILMDRTKFTVINVVSGNQIEATFTITFSSGG